MSEWSIRPARVEDIPVLVQFRSAMFRDMGYADEAGHAAMNAAALVYLRGAMPAGEYRGWVAEAGGQLIASGAYTCRQVAPSFYNLSGRQAYILSIYTRPEWRRQGIARAIMAALLEDIRAAGIPMAYLTASDEGRPLYLSLGFEEFVEMRLKV